jgi:hypothetical protein
MSPTTSNAQSTTQKPSFLRVPATLYTPDNHYKFVNPNNSNLGFFWNQKDFEDPGGISSVRYTGIVSNTDIGDLPEVQEALKATGRQIVRVPLDGDVEAEWKKVEEKTNERFRQMSGKVMNIAQDSESGPSREWKFDNGTDYIKLLEDPSVRVWTTQPPPDGQHSKSSTGGNKTTSSLVSGTVALREKHYVQSDSEDPDNTIESGTKDSRARQKRKRGEDQ